MYKQSEYRATNGNKPETKCRGFIGGAPDAEAETSSTGKREAKQQITVTMDPALVARIDDLAKRMGADTLRLVSLLVFEALEGEGRLTPLSGVRSCRDPKIWNTRRPPGSGVSIALVIDRKSISACSRDPTVSISPITRIFHTSGG